MPEGVELRLPDLLSWSTAHTQQDVITDPTLASSLLAGYSFTNYES